MPLINTSVPNLIQGVSQQPNSARFAGQCEEQENALSSVAEGLKKRPNTRHVAKLLDKAISENSFVHFINRSDQEKYVLIHDGTAIDAWNIITGVKCSINGSTSPFTPPLYLETNTPRQALKGLTVADNTFIVNKEVTVSLSEDKTPPLDKTGFVYIAQGDYEKKYEVTLGGNIAGALPETSAQFEVIVESVYYYGGWNRFRVSGVNITNAGEGYTTATPTKLNLTFNWGTLGQTSGVYTSYAQIYTYPEITITLVDDETGNGTYKVGSATVTNDGRFGQHVPTYTGYSFTEDYGASIEATVLGDLVTGVDYEFSTTGTRNTVASDADTSNIAKSLNSDAYEQSNFDTVHFTGNRIFTPTTTVFDGTTSPPTMGLGYLKSTLKGNTIIIEHQLDEGDFTLTTDDGLGGSGIKGVYKKIDAISSLPLKAPNNFVVEVIGDAEQNEDNYWVKFTTNSGIEFGDGAWEETVAPDIFKGFSPSSMPIGVKTVDLNVIEIEELDYENRKVGDADSNPDPSFVGKSINDIVFFRNRLGFLTDDTVVFSEAGEFFNFYRTTVTSLLDSDPIDVTVSSTKVTRLTSAAIFQENLMLFSDNVQYVLKGGDLLTPETVSISPTTNFNLEEDVSPIALGSYIYFPFTRGSFTGLRELTLSQNTETYDAFEVTEHVPYYIPSDVVALSGTTSEGMIVMLSANERSSLYVYTYFWSNNQKVLSAWSKFTFTGDIIGLEFIESTLYLVTTHANQTQLLEMPLEAGLTDEAGFITHLDMRTSLTVPAGSSSFTIPYKANINDDLQVYTKTGSLLLADHNQNSVQLEIPVEEDTDVWVGLAYNMKYVFSEQVFKQQAENTKTPTNSAKIVIRNGSLFFDDTGAFTVKINSKHRDPIEVPFSSSKVGTTILNTADLDSGAFRFSIGSRPEETVISVENNTALPCKFQSAEFESFAQIRSTRYS